MLSIRDLPAFVAAAMLGAAQGALAADVEVIYTEIATDSSSEAPGMLDLAGAPVAGRFAALFDLTVSHDGAQWIIRADTDLPTTHDQVLILGSGTTGSPLAQ